MSALVGIGCGVARACNVCDLTLQVFIRTGPTVPRIPTLQSLPLAEVLDQVELWHDLPHFLACLLGFSCQCCVPADQSLPQDWQLGSRSGAEEL